MWVVSIAMSLALLYGLFHYNKDNFTVIEPSWLGDLHAATFRTVWGLVLGWITYACLTGWGGIYSSFSRNQDEEKMASWTLRVHCSLLGLIHPCDFLGVNYCVNFFSPSNRKKLDTQPIVEPFSPRKS